MIYILFIYFCIFKERFSVWKTVLAMNNFHRIFLMVKKKLNLICWCWLRQHFCSLSSCKYEKHFCFISSLLIIIDLCMTQILFYTELQTCSISMQIFFYVNTYWLLVSFQNYEQNYHKFNWYFHVTIIHITIIHIFKLSQSWVRALEWNVNNL